MPVPSFSIQYGGEQSPRTKSAEDNLEENMLVQQVEGGNLSMDILGNELISVESDQVAKVPNDQLEENCGEDHLKEFNCGLERPRHQLLNGITFMGNPSLRVDSSQSYQVDEEKRNKNEEKRNKNEENARFLKTDSPQMVVCNILNGHLEAKAPLSEQASCKETTEHFSISEENSFLCLECNKKGSSPEHIQGAELVDTTYVLSEDVLPGKDGHIDGLTEGENAIDASNSGISIVNHTPDSQGEGKEEAGTLTKQSDLAFGTNIEQHNFFREEQKNEQASSSGNSQQYLTYRGVHDCNEDKESDPLGTEYLEDRTVALWVKWRGKWQTGFQCPRIDCPLPTLRAKPTHERKKYIAIFFPRTRRYSWADVLLVRPINEFPEPLASGTHRKWRKLVKDLTTPHRFIMQKLAVAMLNISDQLHTESVTENARKATTWKEFAMEASCCRGYSDLGRMLLKLQTMILPTYVSRDWLENSLSSWIHRCQSVQTADYVEILTEELVASMQWDKVSELWNAPVQPELGPEWKSWKQEAMKWFSTSHPVSTVADIEQGICDISPGMESQISRKRLKLEVRRTENCASQMEISDSTILTQINQVDTDSGHSIFQENLGSRYEPDKEVLPKSAAAVDSATVDMRWNDISAKSEDLKPIQSTIAVSADGNTGMIAMASAPYQYRQCSAFIAVKGRQCGRWASDGEAYCCVHLNSHSGGKLHLEEQRPPPDSPMCEGMTTHGDKCKHRARLGSLFCKKHRLQRNNDSNKMNNLLTPFGNNTKRKICDNAIEKLSSLNASNGEEFGLVREHEICTREMLIPVVVGVTSDERNRLMNESELCSAIPTPVRAPRQGLPRCIGYYGQNNGEQCPDDAKKHTLYCEKHLPRFLKRARNGRSRLVSKDVFLHLLRTCCSRKQKLYLHQACELLYGFMKSSLSRQKPVSKDDIMDWILSEASKDVNVGEYLLKLVSSEREKITKLWSFGDKQSYTTETKMPPSTLQRNGKDQDSEEIVKCKICAGEFSDEQAVGVHWTQVHKKEVRWLFRGYACAVCMSSFTNRKNLEAHVNETHGVQFLEHSILFRCMSCNSHFVNPEQLWQHVLSFHLKEFRMPDQSPDNCHTLDQLDQVSQQALASGNSLCQNTGKSEQEGGSHRYICRFCGLKFDLLPDLGRHHQVAHMNPNSISQFLPKRRNHYVKHNRPCHPRFKKTFGAAYRFKKQTTFGLQKQFPSPNSAFSLRPKLTGHISENMALGRLLEPHCSDVAETLFAEIQKTKPRPSNSEILSIARTACCRISLHAALEVKYGILPENLYLKAAKLCSELNIEVGWHLEGFICPQGCRPHMNTLSVTPLRYCSDGSVDASSLPGGAISDTKWDMEESHFVLSPKDFNWKPVQNATILCEDVSFGKEPVPVACVIDNDLKDSLDIRFDETSYGQATTMPWQGFTYVTKRLIEPSLGLDTKNSHLGCACQNAKCSPEKCDHVYLFDNDNEKAEDIYGKAMHGRFPYDERGQIILEEGHLVYECNSLCKCEATCHNRVLQKGVQVKLEIFRTEKKGWAVRAAEAISRGTFVCEYVGEILNKTEADKRRERYDSLGCSYLYDIDAHISGSKGISEGTVPCIIDATKNGNVSRFINHSCSPNIVNYLVLIESMDCQLAHIGLYASRDIAAGEELAYDYRNKLIVSGGQLCHCGAPNCRHLY